MKNPLDHEKIEQSGIKGLGEDPNETLLAYVYYIESQSRHSFSILQSVFPIHDRLLEATLIIFDTMADDKKILRKLYNEIILSPCILKDFIPAARGFFMRMFMAIGLDEDNIASNARMHVYALYFNCWLSVWFADETADQSNTMAAVDQNLRQLKSWKEWIFEKAHHFG